MVGLIGVSWAQIVLFYGWGTKCCNASFFLFPGLTRSIPKEMSVFEMCLHCLARKRGLISVTKVSVWFVLHHTLLETGKLHKGKTLNQGSALHFNIYCHDSRTSGVTANPGKVWNDSLSYLWGNAICSNHADSEIQLNPALGHRNCQDFWKSSTNLNTTI